MLISTMGSRLVLNLRGSLLRLAGDEEQTTVNLDTLVFAEEMEIQQHQWNIRCNQVLGLLGEINQQPRVNSWIIFVHRSHVDFINFSSYVLLNFCN